MMTTKASKHKGNTFFQISNKIKIRYFIEILLLTSLWLSLSPINTVFSQSIKTLECGTTGAFPPYTFMEEGTLKGVEIEVLQEIGRRLNINIHFQIKPWKRLMSDIKNGKLDCAFGVFKTEDRLEYMDFTNVPIHVSTLVFNVHKDSPIPFNTLEDLKGRTIGLVRGFKTSSAFDLARQKKLFEVQEVSKMDLNFLKLDAKRIDAVLANNDVGAFIIKKLGLSTITALPVPLTATSAYVIFSKEKKLSFLIPQFDATLFKLLTDGTYENIYKKYVAQ